MTKPNVLMLRAIPLFNALPQEALEELAEEMWIQNYRRGESLTGREEDALTRYRETAWFVCRGAIALYTRTSRNRRKILFFQGPGALLNQDVMNGDGQILAEAAADSILLCMERKVLAERIRHTPALAEALFTHYERRLWQLSHQLKNTADVWFVERKLAAKLLKLSADFGRPAEEGVEIGLSLSIQQMADYIGVSRETTSRACKRLAELGLVRYERRLFLIPDPSGLEAFRRTIGSQSKPQKS